MRHAQFEDVPSRIKRMEYRSDRDNPYFQLGASWTTCIRPSLGLVFFLHIADFLEIWSEHTPLYYTPLCGFQNFVEELVVEHPHHVNTRKTLPSSPGILSQQFNRSVDCGEDRGQFGSVRLGIADSFSFQ